MPYKQKNEEEEPEHIHRFGFYPENMDQRKCSCGAIPVSLDKYITICATWHQYYEECRNSPQSRRMREMVKARSEKDTIRFNQLWEENKRDVCLEKIITKVGETYIEDEERVLNNPIPVPVFDDPFHPKSRYLNERTRERLLPVTPE